MAKNGWQVLVDKEILAGALAKVLGAVDRRTTMDILRHVLIEVRGGNNPGLVLTATDLEVRASTRCKGSVDGIPSGSAYTCAPAGLLKEILTGLRGEISIDFEPVKKVLTLADADRVFDVACMSSEEFPCPPTVWQPACCIFQPGQLPALLTQVDHAVSRDSQKANLCGVYLCRDLGGVTAVAVDGYRLSLVAVDIPQSEGLRSLLIPSKAVAILTKIVGTISLLFGEPGKNDNQVLFSSPDLELSVRLLDAQFPDYRRVIPSGYVDHFIVDAPTMAEAVEAVSVVVDGHTRTATLTAPEENLGESLTISSVGSCGVAKATVPCMGGAGLEVSANGRYLVDALKALGCEVFVKYGPGPLLIIPSEHRGCDERVEVIMPVRV